MWLITLFLLFLRAIAIPLAPTSIITMRSTAPSSIYNNPIVYRPLILEEWSVNNQLVQTWYPRCTLPGIQTETYTEGLLRSRYPYMDGVWFLCRDVPVNSSFSYSPAPVVIMALQEDGNLISYSVTNETYPFGTTTNQVIPFYNESLGANIFYMMGGGAPPSSTGTSKPLQPRIRVDYIPRAPPPPSNFGGPLVYLATTSSPSGLAIMTDSLFMSSTGLNGTIATPVIYLVGFENRLPSTTYSVTYPALFTIAPTILSFCTYPLMDVMWYTYYNLVPTLGRTNFTNADATTRTQSWILPAGSPSGTLGGSSWRVTSVSFSLDGGENIYISNGTTVMKNTLIGLTRGQAYTVVFQSPPGWKFMDVYARTQNQAPPNFPSPSSAPTPSVTPSVTKTTTRTPSVTPTLSATTTVSPTQSVTPSPSPSSTVSITPTASVTASASSTTSATVSVTPSSIATPSTSMTPYTVPSTSSTVTPTGTVSSTASVSASYLVPPPSANTETTSAISIGVGTGVSVAVLAVLGAFGFIAFRRIPAFRTYYTRTFGIKAPNIQGTSHTKVKHDKKEIEISQNPFLLSQARAAQLREMQENMSLPASRPRSLSKTKKEFTPNMTTNAVREVRVNGMRGLSV